MGLRVILIQVIFLALTEHCSLANGQCQPGTCRLRREFLDMTFHERVRYINTVKTASTDPTYKERYETLLTSHRDLFFENIHELEFFLPWHRWFILQYENLLQEIDCRVTVPYWDWSLVGADISASDLWNPGPHGFGGDGDPDCVTTGPFRKSVWSLIASAGGGCLRRNFQGRAPDAIAVRELLTMNSAVSQFFDFEALLRVQFHDVVHCVIGGSMCDIDEGAAAPEFFLHHGFIDKIWWDWQQQSNEHTFHPFFQSQTALMPGTNFRSRDFLDLENQPGGVCVQYVPTNSEIIRALQGLSNTQMQSIQRLPLPPLSTKAEKLFRTPRKDLERVARMRKAMSPRNTLRKSSLNGEDAVRGFRVSDLTKGKGKAKGKAKAKGPIHISFYGFYKRRLSEEDEERLRRS